jgi:predicted hydrolase (HD superfamily)
MKTVKQLLKSFEEDPERQEHMEMLADAFYENLQLDNVEFGGWGIDSKRPFGNSLVEPDIAEIIGWDREEIWEPGETGDFDEDKANYVRELYYDLGVYLQYRWAQLKEATNYVKG